jgi:hypothetical protein
MIRNYRRADKNKMQEIRRVRQYFLDAGIPEEDIFFAQIKKVPNATAREHTWAMYYVALGNTPPDENWLKLYREERRQFNKGSAMGKTNPTEEIIGVPHIIEGIDGKKRIIWFEELAVGESARKMAIWCEKPRDGYNEKIKRLHRMSRDHKLKAKHDAHLREIEKKARRR